MSLRLKSHMVLFIWLLFVTPFILWAQEHKEGKPTVILTTQSYWRAFYTLKTPLIRKGDALEEIKTKYDTPLPPKEWQMPDFNDRTWHRSLGGLFRGKFPCVSASGSSTALALLCLRGKFKVSDPSQVKSLTLTADFGGGIIVYLNGKEVTRSHLSDTSQKGMLAIADDYPLEAFLDEEGAPIKIAAYGKGWDKRRDRLRKKHTHRIEDIPVPSFLLRKGVNVLALEIHRSVYPSEYIEALFKKKRSSHEIPAMLWSTCDLTGVQLSALEARGLEPNVIRPQGFQVWNSDLLYPDSILDYGNPAEPLKPITIIGTRNGAFSGKVVVGSRNPIKGVKATIGDLKQKGGTGKIPASSIQIRYAMRAGKSFDALMEQAPDEVPVHKMRYHPRGYVPGAVVPIWFTVKIPADAPIGNYKGDLTIRAEGLEDVKVSVDLRVLAFKIPDPQDFHTFTELIASPESVALYYQAPLWSDKHFQLMKKTYQLLGQIGNCTVYIPLIAKTNFGNAETMVRWIKKGDGAYKHDFTIMDRYLDLVEKHQGKPKTVILYVWDVFLESDGAFMHGEGIRKAAQARPNPQVSLLDPGTGKVSYEDLSQYTDKEASLKIWQPLIAELKENLKKRGLENRVMLGMVPDREPAKEVVSFFKELLPQAPWVRHAHTLQKNLHGQPLGYQAVVWAVSFPGWPQLKSQMGWKRDDLVVQYRRGGLSPLAFRMIGEMNITGNQRGFGRFGGDFWPVLKDKKGKKYGIAARYPQSNWGWLNIGGKGTGIISSLIGPGAEGAVAMVRFEMMREGVQECEARIVAERALADGKITGNLAERCQKILNQRTQAMHLAIMKQHQCAGLVKYNSTVWGFQLGQNWFLASDWQKRSEELYDAAAKVAKK